LNFLILFSAFCGLLASIAAVAGIAILLHLANMMVFYPNVTYLLNYGIPALASFLLCFGALATFLKRYQRNSSLSLKKNSVFKTE